MNPANTLLIFIGCFSIFFIIKWISKPNRSNKMFDKYGTVSTDTSNLLLLHVSGILWLGMLPIILFRQTFIDLVQNNSTISPGWFLSFLAAVALVTTCSSKASRQVHINNKNIQVLSRRFITNYFMARVLFLCSYELFFRGIFLFECIELLGLFNAIIISTGLTVLIHAFSDKKEMLACIPYGIIACVFCISIHAIWPAIILHLAISLTYEIPHSKQFLTQVKTSK